MGNKGSIRIPQTQASGHTCIALELSLQRLAQLRNSAAPTQQTRGAGDIMRLRQRRAHTLTPTHVYVGVGATIHFTGNKELY